MKKLWRVLVPLILVVALGLGVFAYMDNRKQRTCDQWREDAHVATQDAARMLLDATSKQERNDAIQLGRGVWDTQPEGCPEPAIEPFGESQSG